MSLKFKVYIKRITVFFFRPCISVGFISKRFRKRTSGTKLDQRTCQVRNVARFHLKIASSGPSQKNSHIVDENLVPVDMVNIP